MSEKDEKIFKNVCVRMGKLGVASEPDIIVALEKQLVRYRDMVIKLQERIQMESEDIPECIDYGIQETDTVIKISSHKNVASVDIYFEEG